MKYLESLANLDDPGTLKCIYPGGVQRCVLPRQGRHNAVWDGLLAPDGSVYLPLCSELTAAEYVSLCRYDPAENRVETLFSVKDQIFPGERTIRASKFHTSMAWLPDGRIITVTHTTDKAPQHPYWMPQAYYAHPTEGFPGSSLLTYDPKTGKVENWGIPVPWETIYGTALDAAHGVYYALGFLKGELYAIDLKTRSVKHYGQVAERASYRLVPATDGNLYFTSRNGLLQRVNTQTGAVEDTGHTMPYTPGEGRFRPYLSFGLTAPDGRLFLAGMHNETLCAYQPADNTLTPLGSYLPAQAPFHGSAQPCHLGAMGFDRLGVLYYVICTVGGGAMRRQFPAMLLRWDVLHGGKPEYLGLIGDRTRVVTQCCTLLMDTARDRMFLLGTNHADDAPEVISVDLAQFRAHAAERGEITEDPLLSASSPVYRAFFDECDMGREVLAQNRITMQAKSVRFAPLWREFPAETRADSAVCALEWAGDRLLATCKTERFTLSAEGELLAREPARELAPQAAPAGAADLPAYPGRQYKSASALAVTLREGRLIATQDGLLALERPDGSVFALGAARPNAPVNDLIAAKDGSTAYGVAGDPEGFSMVFSYDAVRGLRTLGCCAVQDPQQGIASSPRLTRVALNEELGLLAVGAGGRMGGVYLYRIS